MRAQDKSKVEKGWWMGASPKDVARELNLPLDEVYAIFRKCWVSKAMQK